MKHIYSRRYNDFCKTFQKSFPFFVYFLLGFLPNVTPISENFKNAVETMYCDWIINIVNIWWNSWSCLKYFYLHLRDWYQRIFSWFKSQFCGANRKRSFKISWKSGNASVIECVECLLLFKSKFILNDFPHIAIFKFYSSYHFWILYKLFEKLP